MENIIIDEETKIIIDKNNNLSSIKPYDLSDYLIKKLITDDSNINVNYIFLYYFKQYMIFNKLDFKNYDEFHEDFCKEYDKFYLKYKEYYDKEYNLDYNDQILFGNLSYYYIYFNEKSKIFKKLKKNTNKELIKNNFNKNNKFLLLINCFLYFLYKKSIYISNDEYLFCYIQSFYRMMFK